MESQKDRFIREYMEIRDDRKERGFDRQSIKRRQRIMPEGQKDLGIYPEENSGENPVEEVPKYGSEGELVNYNGSIDSSAEGLNVSLISQSISDTNFEGFVPAIASANLTITNSKIYHVVATNVTLNYSDLVDAPKQAYPATFDRCSFFYVDGTIPSLAGSVIKNSDVTDLQEKFLLYIKTMTSVKEEAEPIYREYLYPEGLVYENCKTIDIDDYF